MIDDIIYKHISKFSEKIVIFFPFVYYPSSDDWENIRKFLEDFNKSLDLDNDFIPSLLGKELLLSLDENKINCFTKYQ